MVGILDHQQDVVIAQRIDDPVFRQLAGSVDVIIGEQCRAAVADGEQQVAGGGFLSRRRHDHDNIGEPDPGIGVAAG